eukprot:718618-Ditylum_brightwellii.AAC.1
MKWHQQFGHIGFQHVQWLDRSGKLPIKNLQAVGACQFPICASCQFGKQKKTSTKDSRTEHKPDKEIEIKKGNLFPGKHISTDHYQSSVPGQTH